MYLRQQHQQHKRQQHKQVCETSDKPAGWALTDQHPVDSAKRTQSTQDTFKHMAWAVGNTHSHHTNKPHTHLRSAVESCTRMAVLSGSSVPNSANSPRGSRTARARYALCVLTLTVC